MVMCPRWIEPLALSHPVSPALGFIFKVLIYTAESEII